MRRVGGALELALQLCLELNAAELRVLQHLRFCILDDALDPRGHQCRRQHERARVQPNDDQRFERELAEPVYGRRQHPLRD